jgi:hypothetical protein
MKQAKAKRAAELGGLKIVPAPFPQEHLDGLKAHSAANWTLLQKLRHPDGDSIDVGIIDKELVGVAIKEGPHEICKLALTYDETGDLLSKLQRARRKVKP